MIFTIDEGNDDDFVCLSRPLLMLLFLFCYLNNFTIVSFTRWMILPVTIVMVRMQTNYTNRLIKRGTKNEEERNLLKIKLNCNRN